MRTAPLLTVASAALLRLAHQRRGSGHAVVYLPNAAPSYLPSPASEREAVATSRRDLPARASGGGEFSGNSAGALRLVIYTRFNEFHPARGAALVAVVLHR